MLLIGSKALLARDIGLLRSVSDTDYICTYTEYEKFISQNRVGMKTYYPLSDKKFIANWNNQIYEFEIAWPGSTAAGLLNLASLSRECVASPGMCLALKLSHRYLRNSPHFLKTMRDIQYYADLALLYLTIYTVGYYKGKERHIITHIQISHSLSRISSTLL